MKYFLRIVVAILIVSLIGYLVWFFFFKPSNDEKVANALQELNSYYVADDSGTYESKLQNNLNKLGQLNGVQQIQVRKYTTDGKYTLENSYIDFADIENGVHDFNGITMFRDLMFKDSLNVKFEKLESKDSSFYVDGYIFCPEVNEVSLNTAAVTDYYTITGYANYDTYLDDIYNNYFAYLKLVDDINSKSASSLAENIHNYTQSLSNIQISLDKILNYQANAFGDNVNNGKIEFTEPDSDSIVDGLIVYPVGYSKTEINNIDNNSFNKNTIKNLSFYYQNFIVEYMNCLNLKSKVVNNVVDIVNEYILEGNQLVDSKLLKSSLFLNQLNNALNTFKDYSYMKNEQLQNYEMADKLFKSYQNSVNINNCTDAQLKNDVQFIETYKNIIKADKNSLYNALNVTNVDRDDIMCYQVPDNLEDITEEPMIKLLNDYNLSKSVLKDIQTLYVNLGLEEVRG